MASEIKLPELGENLTGGGVLEIRVSPGDSVEKGQSLLELEAEKATVEVPSPVSGRVAQVLVKKGDTLEIGQPFVVIEEGEVAKGEAKPAPRAPDAKKEAAPARPADAKKEAAPARPADAKKEPAAAPARDEARESAAKPAAAPAPEAPAAGQRVVPAGPATRRLARELGIDLGQVPGSARGGRVTEEDVKAYVRSLAAAPPVARPVGKTPALPDFERWGAVERRPLDVVRRKTAEQMSLAWSLIPHVTQHDLADITDLDAFRKQQEGSGPKLTVTAFALKAAAIALAQMPQVNSSLDLASNQLIVKQYYHIGVAVDTERGLLVPVLRDVDRKSVVELAEELAAVAERARNGKLALDDMRGGTFTITNLGGIGGTSFTPIVNYPEVAILGLSRARLEPVVRNGQVTPRLLLPLSLSYDHRVLDGADAARFTRRIAQMLENPLLMLLRA